MGGGASQGEYLVAGCTAGALHVWKWESATEVSHVPAHAQRIHHCSVLPSEGDPPAGERARNRRRLNSLFVVVMMRQTDTGRSLHDTKRDSIVKKLQFQAQGCILVKLR